MVAKRFSCDKNQKTPGKLLENMKLLITVLQTKISMRIDEFEDSFLKRAFKTSFAAFTSLHNSIRSINNQMCIATAGLDGLSKIIFLKSA